MIPSRYTILRELGRGGMGRVLLAEDSERAKTVALKCLEPQHAADSRMRERFQREYRALSGLQHAHIIGVYDFIDCQENGAYISLEYIDGVSLREYVAAGNVPLQTKLELLFEVAEALAYSHSQGVVHRDIKPANIVVTKDGHAKLCDFGIAQFEGETRLQIGRAGVEGTLYYLAPEEIREEEIGPSADIYSFGVLCFEIIAGARPFEEASLMGNYSSHLVVEPKRLRSVYPSAPRWLDRLVRICMSKAIDERYPRMQPIVERLRDGKRARSLWSTIFHRSPFIDVDASSQ